LIQDAIIDKTYLAFIILFTIFVLIKWYGILIYKIKDDRFLLFVLSLKIYHKTEIKNTFDKRARYYVFSNKINIIFYPLLLLVMSLGIFFNIV